MNREDQSKSYIMLISAMLIFGSIGIFRRYIPLPSALLAFARGLMGAAVLAAYVKIKGGDLKGNVGGKKLLLLAVTGALMGLNWILLFEAYNYTSVATATLCYYMEPTIVILLSPVVLKEKLGPKKLVCALLAVAGMVFVSGILDGGQEGSGSVKGVVLGLGAAVLYSSVVILNKFVQLENVYQKTIIQLLSASLVLIPYLLITGASVSGVEPVSVIMLVIVGVVHTGLAYALYFGSMEKLRAQSVAVLSYIDPVSALILSALILGEGLTVFGIIGAVLIIGSALVCEVDFKKDKSVSSGE